MAIKVGIATRGGQERGREPRASRRECTLGLPETTSSLTVFLLFALSRSFLFPPSSSFFSIFFTSRSLSLSLSSFADTFLTQAQFYFLRRTPSVSPCEADLAENRVSLYNQIHRTCVTRDCNMCNRNYRSISGIYYGISYKYAARALLATYIYIYILLLI